MSDSLATDLDHILDHVADLWEDLRGARLFITGGTGFVGRWLLESFAQANARLSLHATAVVLTRNPARFQRVSPHLAFDPAIQLHQGDIATFGAPSGVFSHMIHAAANMTVRNQSQGAQQLFHSIVQGTENALNFAVMHQVRRFLLVSSGAVYGRQPTEVKQISEEFGGAPDPLAIGSTYGESKRAAELLCAIYAHQHSIQPTIARGFAFFGPFLEMNGAYAIGNFLRDGLNGGPIRVQGDGSPLRTFLYAADMAIWLWNILLCGQTCRPYNVGSSQVYSIADTARAVSRLWEPATELVVVQQPHPDTLVDRYVPSVARINVELGVAQTIDLHDGLRRWLRFLQS